MKQQNIIQRFCLFLFVLVLAVPALAQKERGGGTFNIGSAADWKTFCDRVNKGETTLNAKMTADIELNADIELGQEIVMVGNQYHLYSGTFDGQGHTLTINWNTGTRVRVAPFESVENTTIKNLHVKGEIKSKGDGLSGLITNVYGTTTISGCIIEVNLKAKTILAGMVRWVISYGKLTITDCIVKGDFTVTKKGEIISGFVCRQYGNCTLTNCLYLGTNNANNNESYTFAGNNTEVKNCYYLNACGKAQGTKITDEQLKNGAVAYMLQARRSQMVWGQTIGTDALPQFTANEAKKICKVDFIDNGKTVFSRYVNKGGKVTAPTVQDIKGTSYTPHHYYALTVASDFNANAPVNDDMTVEVSFTEKEFYEIASKDDWKAFCDIVESGQTSVDAKLMRNVDLGSDIVMAGTYDNNYSGTFDGQNYTLKINWNSSSSRQLAPFQYVKSATIRNLRTQGYIKSITYGLSGLIYSVDGATTISGCVSAVNITSSYNEGGCAAAGMIERVRDNAKVTITDCVVKGKFNATTEKGKTYMAGFVCNQYGTCTLNNCLYVGENNGTGVNTHTFGYKTTLTNCYYLNACGKAQGERIVEKQLKSGEVTKKLQNNRTDKCYWAQQLGEMPDFYNTADKSKANYVYYDAAKKGWVCDDFRLTDGQPLPIGLDFSAANVTYERNFNGTQKATLCLPYDLSAQGFKAYTLSGGNKNEVHFKETKDKLTAYTPYYITADGTPLLGGTNIEVKAYTGANLTTSANGYSIKGTVVSMDNATAAAANAYILQDDGMFHKVTTDNPGATVPAYHAYIICPPQASGAKQLSVVLDGETTGIGDVTNEATDGKNGLVYDLQGRRVADRLDGARHQLPTGIYIVGGRKIIVK